MKSFLSDAMFPVLALTIPSGIAGIAIWIIIVAALIAVVFIACRAMGITIPSWVTQVFWILVIAVVCVWAVKFLMSL